MPVATDGHGLELKNIGPTLSSFNAMPVKKKKYMVVVVVVVVISVSVGGRGGGVRMGTSMGYARHARRKIVIYRSGFDSTLVI